MSDIIKTFPPETFVKTKYNKDLILNCGKYLVVLQNKNNIEIVIYNGTGWSNYENRIEYVYLPAIKSY